MPSRSGPLPSQAVVLCTYNRPADLARTLASIALQKACTDLLVVIVDASASPLAACNRSMVARFDAAPIQYLSFPDRPAGTRQRNYGVEHLPPSVQIVHFIDDDVTLLPGYFTYLAAALHTQADVGGVGGLILDPDGTLPQPAPPPLFHRLFLLESRTPGQVLPSGRATSAQRADYATAHSTQWLSTCSSSYRRTVFDAFRFDPAVEGPSPRLEDLDCSYRVGQAWRLLVEPKARLIHHTSPVHRRTAEHTAYERLARRYWFIEKNIRHPLRKPAFWWATLGELLAALQSSRPEAPAVWRGLLRGAGAVLRRSHPMLHFP